MNALFTKRQRTAVFNRLAQNKQIRRSLPGWGRLHVDRQLPFLCVYRKPRTRPDPGTERLCVAEASYILAGGEKAIQDSLRELICDIAEQMVERFGAFLIMEVWSTETAEEQPADAPPRPGFLIRRPPGEELRGTVEVLQESLLRVRTSNRRAEVAVKTASRISAPGFRALLPREKLASLGAYALGLEVKPVYVNVATGDLFPLLLRTLRHQLGHVLDRTFYHFAHERTTHQPPHFHALGRRAMVKAVWEADRRLAEVSNSFDLLYQVTPVNAEQAWADFKRTRFEKAPRFLYRPRAVDPGSMKRTLFNIPIERVEDPTLAHLFLNKQAELERQLTLLNDMGSRAFLYGGLQLYGEVRTSLLQTATELLHHTAPRDRAETKAGTLTAKAFAVRARREVAWYRSRFPDFQARVVVSNELYSGMLVSRGRLLIGAKARIPTQRANALIQHEVGTHLLTYFNGRAQPFKMLYSGLPGYDELQEGLAVLAEHLAGGLSVARLRVLAGRVVAAHALVEGASFVDVFRVLSQDHAFSQRTAYTITMRIFRGGGLVKDAVYLRGLVGILQHLGKGGALESLFVGKIATRNLGMVEELLHRRILRPTPLLPRYLTTVSARQRLEQVREGRTIVELTNTRKRGKA